MDSNLFRIDLENKLIPLANEFTNSSITRENFDEHFSRVLTAISDVTEIHAPLQTASRKQKRIQLKPWLTQGLLESIKNKQRFYRTCFLNGNDFDKAFYKSYANKLTRVKALAKKLYPGTAITEKKITPKNSGILLKMWSTPKPHLI